MHSCGDLIGRIDGDEFMIVLPNCDKSVAEKRMKEAQQYLQEMEAPAEGITMNFSYSIVEAGEVDAADDRTRINSLIVATEKRLREAKAHVAKDKNAVPEEIHISA
ncbi:MAG: diguanylate cyclase [Oxalobacter sp.]|nr:diguanylate cyclase [Oxalobacter sp.]